MRPYPWYEFNDLTRKLEPYALYSSRRVDFDCRYRPEPDGVITVQSLADSISDDGERYGWITGDPIMRDIVHMLRGNPDGFTKLAQINAEYMNGFRDRSTIDQARIHMITACLVLGSHKDTTVTKNLLKVRALELWAMAWLRSEKKFSPGAAELKATLQKLPNENDPRFHWEVVFRDLGLSDLPKLGEQDQEPDPGTFFWMMRSGS